MLRVNAILMCQVDYVDCDGRQVVWPVGTRIVMDPEKGIALAGNQHFDVEPSDYKLIYMN